MTSLQLKTLWKVRLAFTASVMGFVGILILGGIALAMGISDMIRFNTPDNLGLGIAFMILACGGVPTFFAAWHLRRTIRKIQTSSPPPLPLTEG